MTSGQPGVSSLALACIMLATLCIACSDAGTGNTDKASHIVSPNIADWKAKAESASDALVARGERLIQMCTGCHGLAEGAPSPAGPSLHRVAGRRVGSLDSYPYTQAMKQRESIWTVEEFDNFIASPQAAYPGTGMAFTGIKDSEDRAAIIAFLATRSVQ